MVREYETILYTTEVEDIKELWEEFVEDYGLAGWEDEEGLIISYDNYYFSYATSAIAALEFYAYGKEHGFEAARDKYLALCNYDGDGDLVEALAEIGFGSPFSEDVVKYIYDTIMDTIENDWSNYIE